MSKIGGLDLVSYQSIRDTLHVPLGDRAESTLAGGAAADIREGKRLVEVIRSVLISAGVKSPAEGVSVLSQALTTLEKAQRDPDVMTSVEDPTASLLQSFLAESGMIQAAPAAEDSLEVKFDQNDILGWLGSFFTWWRRIRKHKWLPVPPRPDDIADTFRVAMLGDWGTGLYGAPVCARTIAADARYQLLLHLGDVYYSGTEKEITNRFLKFWPKVVSAMSRAVNSNHEMYSGGHGYFKNTLPAFGQSSSCFALQNRHWLLVGLDSGYQEHDLAKDQAEWLEGLIDLAQNRKVILFSHHQPYSLIERQGPKLVEKLGRLLDSAKIFAWYWGHEHRCVIYDAHPTWGLLGRCVGHGGYPYFRTLPDGAERFKQVAGHDWYRVPSRNLVPGGLLLDGPNSYIEGHEADYGPNGYAVLEFEGEHLHEAIHAPDGTELYRQKMT